VTNRRLATLTAAVALAGAAALGTAGTSHADTSVADDEYWACAALDHVDVGTCLSNPLPDLRDYGSPRQLVRDLTGISG